MRCQNSYQRYCALHDLCNTGEWSDHDHDRDHDHEHVSSALGSERSMAIMAPKKSTSSGTVKNAVVAFKSVSEGQVVSVSGKVMTKSGLMTSTKTGTVWAWVDIQDSEDGNKLRMKGFGAQAKVIAKLEFLATFDFHNFQIEKRFGVQFEASPLKGATVEENPRNLNPDDTWDQREYGPLTDINPGEESSSNMNFLFKVLKKCELQDEWMTVDVTDEESTKKSIKVHKAVSCLFPGQGAPGEGQGDPGARKRPEHPDSL